MDTATMMWVFRPTTLAAMIVDIVEVDRPGEVSDEVRELLAVAQAALESNVGEEAAQAYLANALKEL